MTTTEPTSRQIATTEHIVDALSAAAAERGEVYVSYGRVVFCGLLAMRSVLVNGSDLLAGQPKEWIALTTFATGTVFSILVLRGTLHRLVPSLRVRQMASIGFDALALFTMLSIIIFDPAEGYAGMLRQPYVVTFMLSVVALGLRFYHKAILSGLIANMVAVVVLVSMDASVNGARVDYGAGTVSFFIVLLMVQALIAYMLAARSRSMVFRTAAKFIEVERTRERMGAYLSEELVESALAGEEIELGGVRQPVAILFSDLRGFTSFSEGLEPDELVSQLNDYFGVMVGVILEHGGVVDKYIGDAIMAVFGAPDPRADDPVRALRAAVEMQRALAAHNAERAERGLPPFAQGVGVHFGHVIAGNIGTPQRTQYTIIGDAVNLCSRIEGLTKKHGVGVLATREVLDAARAVDDLADLPPLDALGSVTVRGRATPVEIFAPRLGDERDVGAEVGEDVVA